LIAGAAKVAAVSVAAAAADVAVATISITVRLNGIGTVALGCCSWARFDFAEIERHGRSESSLIVPEVQDQKCRSCRRQKTRRQWGFGGLGARQKCRRED